MGCGSSMDTQTNPVVTEVSSEMQPRQNGAAGVMVVVRVLSPPFLINTPSSISSSEYCRAVCAPGRTDQQAGGHLSWSANGHRRGLGGTSAEQARGDAGTGGHGSGSFAGEGTGNGGGHAPSGLHDGPAGRPNCG